MTPLFKGLAVLLFISALTAFASMVCDPAHGFGRDVVSNAGQEIQNGTK
jgi:predicted small secreted protein